MKIPENSPADRMASVKPNFVTRWGFLVLFTIMAPVFALFYNIHYKQIKKWNFHSESGIGSDSILLAIITWRRTDNDTIKLGSNINVVIEDLKDHKIRVIRGNVVKMATHDCDGLAILKIHLLDQFRSPNIDKPVNGQLVVSKDVSFFQRFVLPI